MRKILQSYRGGLLKKKEEKKKDRVEEATSGLWGGDKGTAVL